MIVPATQPDTSHGKTALPAKGLIPALFAALYLDPYILGASKFMTLLGGSEMECR